MSVIETPGHTSGCISVYTDGIVFVGGALPRSSGPGPWLGHPDSDPAQAWESIARLLDLPNETIVLSGRSQPVGDGRLVDVAYETIADFKRDGCYAKLPKRAFIDRWESRAREEKRKPLLLRQGPWLFREPIDQGFIC